MEHWDDVQKMAFTSVGDEWYGYGTPRSMKEKVYHLLHLNICILSLYTEEPCNKPVEYNVLYIPMTTRDVSEVKTNHGLLQSDWTSAL